MFATISDVQFIRLEASTDRTSQLCDIVGKMQRIKGIVEFATVPQLTTACKSLDGVFVGLAEAFKGHCLRWDQETQDNDQVVYWLLEIEAAINTLLNHGDPEPLRRLVRQHSAQWEQGIKTAAAMPTRGQRDIEERTRVLGKFTAESHCQHQRWTVTAQGVIAKLTPLVGIYKDGDRDWVQTDINELNEYIATNDNERCREYLRHAYEKTQTKRALRGAVKSR